MCLESHPPRALEACVLAARLAPRPAVLVVHDPGTDPALLLEHPGRVFSRDEILERLWGQDYEGFSHAVNAHVQRLRAKLCPDGGSQEYVETVWGTGYRLASRWIGRNDG